jgi:hypothetical protein
MLLPIALLMILLWAVALFTSVTLGGVVHVLLAAAIGLVALRLIQGRRIV